MIEDQILDALLQAQQVVQNGQDVALIVLANEGYDALATHYCSDYHDGQEQRQRFERLVAKDGTRRGANRATLVTNIKDEQEWLYIFSLDLDDGYDIARCAFTRTSNAILFEDVEILEGRIQMTDASPGYALMQGLLDSHPSFN